MRGEPTFHENTYAVCCGRQMQTVRSEKYVEGEVRHVYRYVKCGACGETATTDNVIPKELVLRKRAPSGAAAVGRSLGGGGARRHRGYRRH